MQSLTAAPRTALTTAQVTALLLSSNLTVTSGAELLTSALALSADISDDLESGSIERVMGAKIHGTCKLRIARVLTWGTALVRPYMTLSDGTVTARFNLGVYATATPERKVGETPETYDVEGYDRLYLLDRPVGDTYTVAAGTGYLAAVRSAITAAGLSGVSLDGSAEAKTLPVAAVWPMLSTGTDGQTDNGTTSWLNIVNDLLAAVGYRGVYADENGLFRSEPYANPSARAPEFTFDAGAATILGEARTETADLWQVPNRWIFVLQNTTVAPTEGAGQYTVTNSDPLSPSSTVSRGLTWTRVERVDAADHASLVARGDVIVAADKRVARMFTVTTGIFPVAGHHDVFLYDDPAMGAPVKVQARRWQLNLDGSDQSWVWEAVA